MHRELRHVTSLPQNLSRLISKSRPWIAEQNPVIIARTICSSARRQHDSSINAPKSQIVASPDPYNYTSGHWLQYDLPRRNARHIDFDFPLLCQKAVEACPGASKVVQYNKYEGVFNRVFNLFMDNGVRVIAKLPFTVMGPPGLITQSEVATMTYIKSRTTIPVPDVLDWNSHAGNPIGSEYIIMEHAPGILLLEAWPTMTPVQRGKVTLSVLDFVAEMSKLKFPAYGNLYFKGASIGQDTSIDVDQDFVIGPASSMRHWDYSYADIGRPPRTGHQGPWTSLDEYVKGLIDVGYARLPTDCTYHKDEPGAWGDVEDHRRLLTIFSDLIPTLAKLPGINRYAEPLLIHNDLNIKSIWVSADDPTKITALLDWQRLPIEPAFSSAHFTPDFIGPDAELTAESGSPSGESQVDQKQDEEEPYSLAREHGKIAAGKGQPYKPVPPSHPQFRQRLWENGMVGKAPRLGIPRILDPNRFTPFAWCCDTWGYGGAPIWNNLIRLSTHWTDIGLPGTCPYQPSERDIEQTNARVQTWQMKEKLTEGLMADLGFDYSGWIVDEKWPEAKRGYDEISRFWAETLEKDGSKPRLRTVWPWYEGEPRS